MEKIKYNNPENINELEKTTLLDKLNNELFAIINQELEKNGCRHNVVDEQGNIIISRENFSIKNGGPYGKEEIKSDLAYVKNMDGFFAGITDRDVNEQGENVFSANEKSMAYYRDKYGCQNEEEMIAIAKKNREKKLGNKAEKALMAVFNKILLPDYYILHSSAYDDYKAGVDYLLVNKDTGVVACGFDVLADKEGSEKYLKKIKEARNKARHEGASIKYGLAVDNGKVKMSGITDIPTFCINIPPHDLDRLLGNMNYDSGVSSALELEVFRGILSNLERQAESFNTDQRIKPAVAEKIRQFSGDLSQMQKLSASK